MKMKYFFLGVAAALLLLGIIASTPIIIETPQNNNAVALSFGRYQLSSWATPVGDNGGVIGAFVIDTVTGETRTVYSRTYGKTPSSEVVKNDLKKPFHSID